MIYWSVKHDLLIENQYCADLLFEQPTSLTASFCTSNKLEQFCQFVNKSQLLLSRLKDWNLIEKGLRYLCSKKVKSLLPFIFRKTIKCTVVNVASAMENLGQQHEPNEWH